MAQSDEELEWQIRKDTFLLGDILSRVNPPDSWWDRYFPDFRVYHDAAFGRHLMDAYMLGEAIMKDRGFYSWSLDEQARRLREIVELIPREFWPPDAREAERQERQRKTRQPVGRPRQGKEVSDAELRDAFEKMQGKFPTRGKLAIYEALAVQFDISGDAVRKRLKRDASRPTDHQV